MILNKTKIAIFASHSGSNAEAIMKACLKNDYPGEVVLIISNNSDAYVHQRAKKYNIDSVVINKKEIKDDIEQYYLNVLKKYEVNIICLAGYLKKIPDSLVAKYENRILNIHPALLPKFGGKGMYGINVHRAVIEAKEKESGATIHLVTSNYDEGPILKQAIVKVDSSDTAEILQKKVLELEHKLYQDALREYILESNLN